MCIGIVIIYGASAALLHEMKLPEEFYYMYYIYNVMWLVTMTAAFIVISLSYF